MVEIVPFKSEYSAAFRDLNYDWIEQYFEIEESDKLMLEDPKGHILDKGGDVLIALLDGKPVGTCALIKMEDKKYELAKMAVSKEAQGKKIGFRLGEETIKRAKEIGGKVLFLQTNSALTPAINLYKKLGFSNVSGEDSAYERCDVQMELKL